MKSIKLSEVRSLIDQGKDWKAIAAELQVPHIWILNLKQAANAAGAGLYLKKFKKKEIYQLVDDTNNNAILASSTDIDAPSLVTSDAAEAEF